MLTFFNNFRAAKVEAKAKVLVKAKVLARKKNIRKTEVDQRVERRIRKTKAKSSHMPLDPVRNIITRKRNQSTIQIQIEINFNFEKRVFFNPRLRYNYSSI